MPTGMLQQVWKIPGNDKFYFTAPNYDYFIDCPMEIGNQTDFEFDIDGRKHIFSIFGEVNYDKEKLILDITKIVKYNYDFWGDVPYKKYLFITHCTPHSGEGLNILTQLCLVQDVKLLKLKPGTQHFLSPGVPRIFPYMECKTA